MKKLLGFLLLAAVTSQAASTTLTNSSLIKLTNYVHQRISTYHNTNVFAPGNSPITNSLVGLNAGATNYEFKALIAGSGVTLTYGIGSITIAQSAVTSLADGSVGAPSLNFANSLTTGLYRVGADSIGIAAAGVNQVTIDTTGLSIATGLITSGTYTPTLSNISNIDSSSASFPSQYMRVGNVVTVSGFVVVNPTTIATESILSMTLPIASDIQDLAEVAGTSVSLETSGQSRGAVAGDSASNTAYLVLLANDTGNLNMYYTYTYLVQ